MRELPIAHAAAALGLTLDVCRARVRRGQLQSVKRGNRIYVLVPDEATNGDETASRHDESSSSQSGPDTRRDSSVSSERLDGEVVAALIAQLEAQRQQIADMSQHQAELTRRLGEANSIIMQLSQRPLELAASSPPAGTHAGAGSSPLDQTLGDPMHAEPPHAPAPPAASATQEPARPWWRRWLG